MAAITNVAAAPSTGALNPVVTFTAGDQDQGGEIRASTLATNIAQGDPNKLTDGNTYRISYDSAGHHYGPVKKEYVKEFGKTEAIFTSRVD